MKEKNNSILATS